MENVLPQATLLLLALLCLLIIVLAAIYVCSRDPARRQRVWRLLRLLLDRSDA
jgi:preprotein translocase subunit SecG